MATGRLIFLGAVCYPSGLSLLQMSFQMSRFIHLHTAIALLVGATAGCSGDDDPPSFEYTISYVNGDESRPNFWQALVYLDEDAASLKQKLVLGGGTLDAAPRGASRYEIKIVDTNGKTAKLITCEVDDVVSGQQDFTVPLILGGSYIVSIFLDGVGCATAQ